MVIERALRGSSDARLASVPGSTLWMVGAAPILDRTPPQRVLGAVVASLALDGAFLREVRRASGQELSLGGPGARLSTTLAVEPAALPPWPAAAPPEGVIVHESALVGGHLHHVATRALPVDVGATPGVVRVLQSQGALEAARARLSAELALGTGALGLALALGRRWLQPLARLAETARAFAAGDLSRRAEVSGDDELARLVAVFNEMAASLERQHEALRSSEARLRFLLEAGPAVIYTCEPSGDYPATFVSENVRELETPSRSPRAARGSVAMHPLRVLLVDTAASLAQTLARFLLAQGGFVVVGAVERGEAALARGPGCSARTWCWSG